MKLLIEEEEYPVDLLESIFDDLKFYKQNGLKGTVKTVGYYHSYKKKELVLMLPKVFMQNGVETVFKGTIDELYNSLEYSSIKHDSKYQWLRELSIHFYNSLVEYNNRWNQNGLISPSRTFELNTNLGEDNYSYLDILLSIVNFYKKNKTHILYRHIEQVTNNASKPKWDKTIRKSLPLMANSKTPIYFDIRNKKKIVNTEEELITYFFSILNHLNNQHNLNLKLDKSYKLFKDDAFINLCKDEYGLRKLKKIKYRYFNDTLKRMYQLCELYFSNNDYASSKKEKEEFLCTNNYNIIFEDMIDKLFTDKIAEEENIQNLKKNKDGKIIDHIYEDKSLIDRSNIFFIGDSKYYKSDNTAGQNSKYKQITYAKNIIQYNIDLWNTKGEFHNENIRYRDDETEGYNITPNFFIYGHIEDPNDFENPQIIQKTLKPEVSCHWSDRLFDRDTLFVHQYSINFLFVLKSYTSYNSYKLKSFRDAVKKKFRSGFIDYFNNAVDCGFSFYQCTLQPLEFPDYIRNRFKDFNGKSIITQDNRLIIAIHQNDDSLNQYLLDFEPLENFQ
tara:strand:+ start:6261 stop:7937 length:1677 start_codon:yes stop_codon:yes gene_type:complete